MSDIRLIGFMMFSILLVIGLLAAKAFAFSIAWVLWPIGILAVLFALLCFVLSNANVG